MSIKPICRWRNACTTTSSALLNTVGKVPPHALQYTRARDMETWRDPRVRSGAGAVGPTPGAGPASVGAADR
jgi:hypothetical protein